MGKTRAIEFRGPLSALGAIVGLLAAGIIVPDGCVFTEAQAARQHLTLPLAMPLALWLAAWLWRGPLQRSVFDARRRWIWIALAVALTGEIGFNLAAGAAQKLDELPQNFLIAWWFFLPLLAALLPLTVLLAGASRAAGRVRPRSILDGVARRQIWLVALGSIAPLSTLVWGLADRPMAPLADAVWLAGAAAIPVLAVFFVLDGRARRRLVAALAGSEPRGESELPDGPLLDIGIGDELRGPPRTRDESEHPYRAGPRDESESPPTVLGSVEPALALIARARRRDALVFALALAGTLAGAWMLAHLAPPPDAAPIGFRLFHC